MTCVNVKNGQKKYGKWPVKLVDKIPWSELCVYLVGPCKILSKGKYPLILKSITMIDPVTGWFEITQYNDKKSMMIVILLEDT